MPSEHQYQIKCNAEGTVAPSEMSTSGAFGSPTWSPALKGQSEGNEVLSGGHIRVENRELICRAEVCCLDVGTATKSRSIGKTGLIRHDP